MTKEEFLDEMLDTCFPSKLGRIQYFNEYDPPYTKSELTEIENEGIIVVNWKGEYFQLTEKAAELKTKMDIKND